MGGTRDPDGGSVISKEDISPRPRANLPLADLDVALMPVSGAFRRITTAGDRVGN